MSELAVSKMAELRSRLDYQGAILGLVCAVVTLLLLMGKQVTDEPIRIQEANDLAQVLNQVLPSKYYDNKPIDNVVVIEDKALSKNPIKIFVAKKEGAVSASVFKITTIGYGGDMELMIALNASGEILGLRVLKHKETPGLADKIETDKSDWITRFNGDSLAKTPKEQWAVKKDGGKYDQFTGATITPRAVVKGVVSGLEFYARHADELTANK